MKSTFLLVITLLVLQSANARNSFVIGLLPNTLISNPVYQPYNRDIPFYIEGRNAAGIGLQLAYQKEIGKNTFVNIGGRVLSLRGRVDVNIEQTGFNDISDIEYTASSGFTDYAYFTGAGINPQIGYNLRLARKSYVSFIGGFHLDFPIMSPNDRESSYNTGKGFHIVYYDEYANEGLQPFYWGVDATVLYNLKVGQYNALFLGVTANIDPGQGFDGTFVCYPSLPDVKNAGTFSAGKSFVGLVLGIKLSK